MLKKTEDIIGASLDYFPLKSNTNIREGNALRMDWDEIFSNKNNIVPPPETAQSTSLAILLS